MKRWLILFALVQAASAHADPPDAATLYDEGKRHFDIGDYAAAITSWKQSYLVSSEPLLLFNLGQAYRLSGNCAQANRFYLNYKRAVPAPANGVELEQAMTKCAGVEPATGEADAPPAPPPVTPPPVTRPPPPVVVEDSGRTLRTAGLVSGGVGLALGAIAVVAGIEASSKADDVARQQRGTTWSSALAAEQASGQAWQTRARVFGALGGAAVIGGGVAWWLGHRDAPRIDVAVGAGRAEVSWACAF